METKEFAFTGKVFNGFTMLFAVLLGYVAFLTLIVMAIVRLDAYEDWIGGVMLGCGVVLLICNIICSCSFLQLEPNEACVFNWFGQYEGTLSQTGFFWVNPFYSAKKLSHRARNFDGEPIKVNDKQGNPIMIGMVLVWRLKDTYRAMYDVDAQTMASNSNELGTSAKSIMNALEKFVRVQSDAALRQVAGLYAYDSDDAADRQPTLRSNADEINDQLEEKLSERLSMAGIEVVEARINYLAYAPEIAAVMLRRQQASAIISAREKIVEGAVGMVKLALEKLSQDAVCELDEEKKAAMVSNLLVVLCADENAQPVLNTGTLNH